MAKQGFSALVFPFEMSEEGELESARYSQSQCRVRPFQPWNSGAHIGDHRWPLVLTMVSDSSRRFARYGSRRSSW